jgi:hypothetical protein
MVCLSVYASRHTGVRLSLPSSGGCLYSLALRRAIDMREKLEDNEDDELGAKEGHDKRGSLRL